MGRYVVSVRGVVREPHLKCNITTSEQGVHKAKNRVEEDDPYNRNTGRL